MTKDAYYSPRWKKIVGYENDDFPNRVSSFHDLIHPDDKAAFYEAGRAHLEEGKPYSVEYRMRHKSGAYIWVQFDGKAVRDASGRPVRIIGSLIDISERKYAKAELEESNASLARAEELARLGHYKYNYEMNTYFWSKGVYRIMGHSSATFTPTLNSVLDLAHPEDRPIFEQYRNDVRAGFDGPSVTVRVVKNTGEVAYVELWSKSVRASDGSVTGVFGTIQDVSERKKAELKISYMARHDALTGLGNRAALAEQLEKALAQSRQCQRPFSVLLLDLDGFKYINNSLGHLAGDALLKELAVRLSSTLRETDFLARLGGDEFAIIQSNEINSQCKDADQTSANFDPRKAAIGLAVRLLEIVAAPFNIRGP